MSYVKARLLWLAWLGALGLGATAAAEYGTHGSWYQGVTIGAAVGISSWFRRPERGDWP